ncbi:MAG: septation protein SpoVG family protein [Endomicrobiia bacterium]|nr:septation protein SpoVG family protein [Endomicrobiia bacterium]
MFKKLFAAVIVSVVIAGVVYAQQTPAREIVVTAVEVAPMDEGPVKGLAKVTINDVVEISEIQVLKVGGRTSLKFPEYISKKGKVYPQITVHTKQANDALLNAIETGKPSAGKAKAISFKVTKFSKFTRPSKLKVFAAVMFNDAIEVECKIMEGNKGPWVSWPARKPDDGGRKWINQVAIKNKAVKDAIEKTLQERYAKMGSGGEDEYE